MEKQSQLQYVFDLKGSLVDRKTMGKTKPRSTLKDMNFMLVQKAALGKLIDLPEDVKENLLVWIGKDVNFLASEGIMDYSLLLAVEGKQTK